MTRFTNLIIITMLSTCIYVTFSVKDDVTHLAKKVASLKSNIYKERETIDIYKAELAHLTHAAHIEYLKKRVLPEFKIVSVEQIDITDTHHGLQFAETTSTHAPSSF